MLWASRTPKHCGGAAQIRLFRVCILARLQVAQALEQAAPVSVSKHWHGHSSTEELSVPSEAEQLHQQKPCPDKDTDP